MFLSLFFNQLWKTKLLEMGCDLFGPISIHLNPIITGKMAFISLFNVCISHQTGLFDPESKLEELNERWGPVVEKKWPLPCSFRKVLPISRRLDERSFVFLQFCVSKRMELRKDRFIREIVCRLKKKKSPLLWKSVLVAAHVCVCVVD